MKTWAMTVLVIAGLFSQAAAGRKPAAGAEEYVTGLDALSAGIWAEACKAFDKATAADGENADYFTARGVAEVLAERFDAAEKDLEKSLNLRGGDRETRTWLAAAYRMGGDPAKGSQYYSIGEGMAADYSSLVYNEMAMVYWQSKYKGSYFDKASGKNIETKEPVKKDFPRAAEMFVKRHRAGGPASSVTLERMKAHYEKGEFAAALKDLELLRATSPDDAELMRYQAGCCAGVGDWLGARELYTRLLCRDSGWAGGYAGRALAAAKLGDKRRAEADLKTAERLTPAEAKKVRADVDQAVGQIRPGEPAAALAALEKAAELDAAWAELIDKAAAVHRTMNAKRLYLDESYQDRLRALREAVGRGDDADRLEELARFLFLNAEVMTVWDGPRLPAKQLRLQTAEDAKREMAESEQTVDRALKVNPSHAEAMATKAWLLYRQGQSRAALDLVEKGLARSPSNWRLLKLKAQIHTDTAARLRAEASSLRTPKVDVTFEEHGDTRTRITRTTYPTAAELALADENDRQADAEAKLAGDALGKALSTTQGKVEGHLLRGESEQWKGRMKEAVEAYEAALKLDAENVAAHRALAGLYAMMKEPDKALDHHLAAANLQTTTCTPLLAAAWSPTARGAARTARELLARAAAIDPADPRWAAYRCVVEEVDGKNDKAMMYSRVGLALVEARSRMRGQSLDATGTGPVTIEDLGPAMALRQRLSKLYASAGNADRALAMQRDNAALEPRITRGLLIKPFPTAMLPDPAADPTLAPEAGSILTILGDAHVAIGRALLAEKKYDDADKEFGIVWAYQANWPMTEAGRETVNTQAAMARLGLVRVQLAKGNLGEAKRLMMRDGWPGGLPADVVAERKEIEKQLNISIQEQAKQERKREEAMTPAERQKQSLKSTIAGLQQQKADLQTELDKPGQSDRQKQVLRGSIEELDKAIRQYQQKLDGMGEGP